MDKKLPGIFANKIDKPFANNERVAYGAKEKQVEEERSVGTTGKNVNQKIHDIFASPRYVYKADVKIVTNNGTFTKKIIGQNNTHLITIDNELLPISDIVDISFVDQIHDISCIFKFSMVKNKNIRYNKCTLGDVYYG